MKLFGGTTPQERAISTLIHDHNGACGRVKQYVQLINWAMKNNDYRELSHYLEMIEKSAQEARNVLDAYLTKAQNDFN